jgi:nitroreductase
MCNIIKKGWMELRMKQKKTDRVPQHDVARFIVDRWSPRALSGESITHDELMSLFEAARWAPSSYNNQPWHFIYAYRDTPQWQTLFNLMVPFNQNWTQRAAVLMVIISRTLFDNGKPSRTHSFDTGAACQNLALQGSYMGLVVLGMEGFDYDRARTALAIPNEYAVQAMFAVGRLGDNTMLSAELQKREKPSDRKPITTFIHEGKFSL